MDTQTYAPTALQVKELRMRTGFGMMECKNALVESSGDLGRAEAAIRAARHEELGSSSSSDLSENIGLTSGGVITKINDQYLAYAKFRCSSDQALSDGKIIAAVKELFEACAKSEAISETTDSIKSRNLKAFAHSEEEGEQAKDSRFDDGLVNVEKLRSLDREAFHNLDSALVATKEAHQIPVFCVMRLEANQLGASYVHNTNRFVNGDGERQTGTQALMIVLDIKKGGSDVATADLDQSTIEKLKKLGNYIGQSGVYHDRAIYDESHMDASELSEAYSKLEEEVKTSGKKPEIVEKILKGKRDSYLAQNTLLFSKSPIPINIDGVIEFSGGEDLALADVLAKFSAKTDLEISVPFTKLVKF